MRAIMKVHHEEIFGADQKVMKANPEEIESEAEYEKVHKEHATVETGRAPNRQHTDRCLARKRRGQPEDRTWGNCGSWKKLTATGRTVTRCAGVGQRKGNVVGKNWTRGMVQGTLKRQTFRRRYHPKPERKNGIRN
jgi:hypothetical protein